MTERERLVEVAWFWSHLEYHRHRHGGAVNSGGRSKEINDGLDGSSPKSLHIWGLAADLYFSTKTACRAFFEEMCALGMGGYIRESGTSCHIQRWPKGTGPRP